ncbi:MAG TPA: cupredoxin domain-containing protein [Candidatus Limnocylindria bacterium]|nr:cupredoxin domain-containing protein [Candidatus Limnocylindria bacterium]
MRAAPRVVSPCVVALVPIALAFLTACVPAEQLPSTCNDTSVNVSATVTSERLDPATIDVCKGQQVTISVASQADGELHFHGYDEEVPEQEIAAGQSITVKFTAVRSGQFPIELHPADGSEEVQLGTLFVHEH